MDDEINTLEGLAAALGEEEGQAQDAPDTNDQQAADDQAQGDHEGDLPEGEQPEDDEAAADDAGQADAPADDAVVKWTTASGEQIEAPLAELKAGYLRQSDYTQKTQQLAEERKQVEVEVAQEFQKAQQLTRDHARLMQMADQIGTYQKADWNALFAENPTEAARLQANWKQLEAQAQNLAHRIGETTRQRDSEAAQTRQQELQKAMESLQREIPNFGPAVIQSARDTALAHGYTEAELEAVTDPRALKVLHEAAQWRALQAKKPAIQNKVAATPPKTTKPGKAVQPTSRVEAAMSQLKARGDVHSLAAVLAATEL